MIHASNQLYLFILCYKIHVPFALIPFTAFRYVVNLLLCLYIFALTISFTLVARTIITIRKDARSFNCLNIFKTLYLNYHLFYMSAVLHNLPQEENGLFFHFILRVLFIMTFTHRRNFHLRVLDLYTLFCFILFSLSFNSPPWMMWCVHINVKLTFLLILWLALLLTGRLDVDVLAVLWNRNCLTTLYFSFFVSFSFPLFSFPLVFCNQIVGVSHWFSFLQFSTLNLVHSRQEFEHFLHSQENEWKK